MSIDYQLIDSVLQKGRDVDGYPKGNVKIDACGAFIIKELYDGDNDYAWVIDHIIPQSFLEGMGVPEELINDIVNLRPLNRRNDVSKGNDFPNYEASVTRSGDHNIEKSQNRTINAEVLEEILNFYRNQNYDIKL